MKPLVFDLYKDAGVFAYDCCKKSARQVQEPDAIWLSLMMGKYTELIVQECIKLLPEDCQSKNGCHTSWVIKEHFGVE